MRHLGCCFTSFLMLLAIVWQTDDACAQDDSGFKYIEVQVVGPEGKPLADVAVDIKIDGMEFPMPTDDEGKISLNAPSSAKSRLQLSVKHDEYVAVSASWRGGDSFPAEFSIVLEKGEPIGGVVLDEQGEPIEGVKIEGMVARVAGSAEAEGKLQPLLQSHLATTGEKGRWQIMTNTKTPRQLFLMPSHDDYISRNSNSPYGSFGQPANWEQLKNLEHKLVLKKGIELKGRVTEPSGEPIAGALVFLGSNRWNNNKQETKTDAAGNYRLGNVAAGNTVVTVSADGWAPELRVVPTNREMEPVNFKLQPGNAIHFLVTDPDGEPLARVGIAAENWRGHQTLPQELYRGKTDNEGVWETYCMPPDEISFSVFKQGHMSSRNNKLAASDETHTIVLQWPLVVSGKVVDAESGLPLEKFDVVRGVDFGNNNPSANWQRHDVKQGTNGKYRREFNEPYPGYLMRIEAEGYRPGISRVIRSDEGEVTINFELEEGTGPSGVVKTPDGKPAVGAKLIVATREEGLHFNNGKEQNINNRRKSPATSDEHGKYTLPFLEDNFVLICLHESGWARMTGKQVGEATDIQLQAWATVEGTIFAGNEPLAGEQIVLHYEGPHEMRYDRNTPQVYWNYSTQSNAVGKFRFDRIQGREAVVARSVRYGDQGNISTYSHREPVALKPGKTVQVQIGGTGRAIKGQIKVPEDSDEKVLWSMGSVQLSERSQRANAGGFFQALGRAIAGQGNQPKVPQKPTFRRSYASAIDAEGGFAITDVLPGQYQMAIQLQAAPVNGQHNWQPIGMLHQSITIPKSPAKNDSEKDQGPHDLGEFTLKMTKPTPPNGAASGVYRAPPVPAE